jgi:hypothetical protein
MDDILFRHTAIATPCDKSKEFLDTVEESEQNKALVKEAKAFDAELEAMLNVSVPDNLADKILLEQSFAIENDKKSNNRWHIAIAASIAFIIGISLPSLSTLTQAPSDIGTVAMEHVINEYYMTSKIDEKATLPMINAKLASYGGEVKSELGEVTFVNFCDFKGTRALHMVMKGEAGPVTVFVVPGDSGLTEKAEFHDSHLKGLTEKMGHADVVIVGEKNEPLDKVQSLLKESIVWDI